MNIHQLEAKIDRYLDTKHFREIDCALNGIQVLARENRKEIRHICTAVDATEKTIAMAIKLGADVLLTHHGLIWGKQELLPLNRNRVRLEDANCSLMSYHLPLDSNFYVGNNAELARVFCLKNIEPFGKLPNGLHIGVKGVFSGSKMSEFLSCPLVGRTKSEFSKWKHLFAGNQEYLMAIVSGAGGDFFQEAKRQRVRLFVTGECRYQDALFVEDEQAMTVEFLGHHASETLGIRALGDLIWKTLEIRVTHLDAPIPA